MDASLRAISPLRQRMIEDMRLRKLNPKTQSAYLRSVSNQLIAPLRHDHVQRVQVQVRQPRADDRPLRGAARRRPAP